MRIVINDVPPSLNQYVGRENVWAYRQAKKEWTEMVYYAAISKRPPMPINRAYVHIHVVYPDRRRHDVGNHEKFLTDGLVKAGIIADDDYSHMELYQTGWWEKGTRKTIIFVQEIETPSAIRHKLALGIPLTDEEHAIHKASMDKEGGIGKAFRHEVGARDAGRRTK